MWVRVNSQRPLMFVLVAMVGIAWISLWAWGASPYGQFLSHEELGHTHLQGGWLLTSVFVLGWTLMTVAMMLPTSLPLVMMFHAFASRRSDRVRLTALLISGYLGIWALFGALAHSGDRALHELVERTPWLHANTWLISAATLVLAGLYQFTPLKYQCLDKCRSPMSFIIEHWRGRQEGAQAFLLGVHHGLFCIGCCWALMLLMFAVGAGNLAWMLALGAVMAVEKNAPWGRRLSVPLGVMLVGSGLALTLLAAS